MSEKTYLASGDELLVIILNNQMLGSVQALSLATLIGAFVFTLVVLTTESRWTQASGAVVAALMLTGSYFLHRFTRKLRAENAQIKELIKSREI